MGDQLACLNQDPASQSIITTISRETHITTTITTIMRPVRISRHLFL
jgi:hypothetical protein